MSVITTQSATDITCGVAVVGLGRAAIIALGFAVVTSSAIASAGSPPDVTGKKYGDASSTLSGAGYQPVVSTTVGDRVPWSDCIVVNVQGRDASPPPNSTGGKTHQALVSLNCDAAPASATKPGFSAQSPQGRDLAKATH